jgi:hypothetical protein
VSNPCSSPGTLRLRDDMYPFSLVYPASNHNFISSNVKYTLKTVDKDAVEDTIIAANNDNSIDGIIVYVGPTIPMYLCGIDPSTIFVSGSTE